MHSTVFIGLGSNLADPIHQIKTALRTLHDIEQTQLVKSSSLYRSPPMGPPDQPAYINAVAQLETTLTPLSLLMALQVIEINQGRVRQGERWGPRTLDLDILLFDDLVLDTPALQIPHPGLHERSFVLYPLSDVAPPDLPIPGHGRLAKLREQCPATGLEKLAE
ncbi:MAG: 2-amino-4-hydroxy-6-hydroxymethyldihydropteridine diphosphokinase [Gammaproteobacteria bacterium]|nr:2-amino-4-hydroxy-6-hydroxymethyldihydropteridine diphosphokinase [Gammaproteobacteria bacterium]MDH5650860.1 2-amino-4-hydroxy-6-hydroxymethyldihydropteridine diphosphokinase [Gammaproteobacteria bacterium]